MLGVADNIHILFLVVDSSIMNFFENSIVNVSVVDFPPISHSGNVFSEYWF
jgi:hypothetical protein